jgi:hypothetical protein
MRPLVLLTGMLLLGGCRGMRESPPPYSPESFRTDIKRLIQARRYDLATAYVRSADPARQAAFDKTGYLAVGEDDIVLPGLDPEIRFDRSRDWFMPGTSDAVEDEAWQRAATRFAAAYNQKQSGSAAP